MSVTYSAAPQVAGIAGKLIREHHDHLNDVTVEFVYRSEHAERHGNVVLGKARKVSGLNAFLVHQGTGEGGDEPFFVIEIAEDTWVGFDDRKRQALVDHELSYCRTRFSKDCELQLYIAMPDIEDFPDVVERWGAWQPNLKEFFKAARRGGQLSLDELIQETEFDNETGEVASISDMAAAR